MVKKSKLGLRERLAELEGSKAIALTRLLKQARRLDRLEASIRRVRSKIAKAAGDALLAGAVLSTCEPRAIRRPSAEELAAKPTAPVPPKDLRW